MGVEMIRLRPKGSCPKCGNSRFIILECCYTGYVTDRDGYLNKFKDLGTSYIGCCSTCGAKYKMVEAYNKLIPLTPLRALCRDYEPDKLAMTNNVELKIRSIVKNPMNISGGDT